MKNSFRFADYNNECRPKILFDRVYDHLMDNGAECVILGCTDISVDFQKANKKVIDSLDVLVAEIIKETDSEKQN